MASVVMAPSAARLALSPQDTSVLYLLAYFPRAKEERRRALLAKPGLTDSGKRIARYLLGEAEVALSERERFWGDRYKESADWERLRLASPLASKRKRARAMVGG